MGKEKMTQFSPGNSVLAMYPECTTFYTAIVMSVDLIERNCGLKFEGDEPLPSGELPIHTIPARFCCLLREAHVFGDDLLSKPLKV
jgi:hypothetical protein